MISQKPPIRVDHARAHLPHATTTRPTRRCSIRSKACVIEKETTSRPHEMGARGVLQGVLRGRRASKMRFRPSFFPSPSPRSRSTSSARATGGEIRFGEGEDWLEILGCGMVHPNVLRNCGLDPDVYQGFAWGMGIDRIAMLKYGMPDLRPFFEADIRWLRITASGRSTCRPRRAALPQELPGRSAGARRRGDERGGMGKVPRWRPSWSRWTRPPRPSTHWRLRRLQKGSVPARSSCAAPDRAPGARHRAPSAARP